MKEKKNKSEVALFRYEELLLSSVQILEYRGAGHWGMCSVVLNPIQSHHIKFRFFGSLYSS